MTQAWVSSKIHTEELMLALSQECMKLPALAKAVGAKMGVVRDALEDLTERGILSQNGVFTWLPDRPFKFWLHRVYRPRRHGVLQNLSQTRERFVQDLERYIQDFIHGTNGKLGERVETLLGRFSNERVRLDAKPVLLPQFKQIETGAGPDLFFAARGDHPWSVQISTQRIGEEDILEFMRRCKGHSQQPHRRVVVALKGMDENARLLAKQKHIWGWELSQLNFLMDLYNQPVILRPPIADEKVAG